LHELLRETDRRVQLTVNSRRQADTAIGKDLLQKKLREKHKIDESDKKIWAKA